MKGVRAFVGHSFSIDDEIVVGKFLTYFDAIAGLDERFSWEHAEGAEPVAIDDKVLRLFDGKNLFIGICTRKELAIRSSAVRQVPFLSSTRVYAHSEANWKTSDWIIQEIGLAVGRGMSVILLVEDGVRSPGGIQGTLEYIPFRREEPEQSFKKLLEMVAAIAGPGSAVSSTSGASPSPELPTPASQEWLKPAPSWNRTAYERAYMYFTAVGKRHEAEAIEKDFFSSPLSSDSAATPSWLAFAAFNRLRFSIGGSVEALVQLAQKYPESSEVLAYLARANAHIGERRKAVEIFQQAATFIDEKSVKIQLLGEAVQLIAHDDTELAASIVANVRSVAANDPRFASEVLTIEADLAKAKREPAFAFASEERLLEDDPENHSKRFDLAYAYSEASMTGMALFHYSRIPRSSRNEAAWNNLGVAYENNGVLVKSVDAYRQSVASGGTLAASNLAIRYIGAGFVQEASTLLREAQAIADHSTNVDSTLVSLDEGLKAQEAKLEKVLAESEKVSHFYRRMGVALAAGDVELEEDNWIFEGVKISLSIASGVVRANGAGKENALGLRRLASSNDEESFELILEATARGRAGYGTLQKRRNGNAGLHSIFSGDEKESIALIVRADETEIEVLKGVGESRKLVVMRRMADVTGQTDRK